METRKLYKVFNLLPQEALFLNIEQHTTASAYGNSLNKLPTRVLGDRLSAKYQMWGYNCFIFPFFSQNLISSFSKIFQFLNSPLSTTEVPAHQGVREFKAFILACKSPESVCINSFFLVTFWLSYFFIAVYLFYCIYINLTELLHANQDGHFLFVIAITSCKYFTISIKLKD